MTPCNQISTFVQQHRRNLPNYVQKVAVLIRDACIASFHAKSYHADSETLDSSPVFPSKLCVFDCIFGQKLTELKKKITQRINIPFSLKRNKKTSGINRQGQI